MPPKPEIVIENDKTLPEFTKVGNSHLMISFPQVLEKILKYYATSGINVPIKMSEFYEFQKAYALLLGVLASVGYHSYRSGIAIKKAIVNFENIGKITEVGTISNVVKAYWRESSEFKELKKAICVMPRPQQKGGQIDRSLKQNKYTDPAYHCYTKYKTKYLKLSEYLGLNEDLERRAMFWKFLKGDKL